MTIRPDISAARAREAAPDDASWRNAAAPMAPSPSHARARTAPASRADLVELRQGGGQRPLFIADANFGEALALRPIAEQLRIDRPIDLLQMRGGDSHDEPHATIAEMAEALIETMRARQPAGPYAIAGFSVGGIVAYEMACRLRERGDAVDLLALIGVDIFAADRAVFSRLTQASRRLARSLRRLTIRPPRQWAGYAACALRARAKHGMARVGIRMQGAAPTETKRVLPPLYIRRCEDIAAYRPRRYDGTVSLFPSTRGAFSAQHPSAALRRAAAAVAVYEPAREDGAAGEQPRIAAIARQIERCLAGLPPSAPPQGSPRSKSRTGDAAGGELKRLFARLAGDEARIAAPSLAIVVAHPDDETIGIGAQLARLDGVLIVHLTNGAPRAMRDARALGFATRAAYAAARRAELERALAAGAAQNAAAIWLDIDDQELAVHMAAAATRLAALFADEGIAMVLTHPFEGGHPDHDAAAFAVRAAASLMARAGGNTPDIGEMAFYHAGVAGMVRQSFPAPGPNDVVLRLDDAAWARKSRMMAEFLTQHGVLAEFGSRIERLRLAPVYNFTAPDRGPLLYDGQEWRLAARDALAELDLAAPAPR